MRRFRDQVYNLRRENLLRDPVFEYTELICSQVSDEVTFSIRRDNIDSHASDVPAVHRPLLAARRDLRQEKDSCDCQQAEAVHRA
jgi:hypothetical protein